MSRYSYKLVHGVLGQLNTHEEAEDYNYHH